MSGGLRRRRGNDAFEVSDSEDEAAARRKKKQAEFRQMQKALLSDERIGKIAQNPKQAAFFKTLADHDDDPDYDFLDAPPAAEDASNEPSQSPPNGTDDAEQNNDIAIPDSQSSLPPPNPLKRKFTPPTTSQDKENRPPPALRRTAATDVAIPRKPLSHADIQHSITELIEDAHSGLLVPDSQIYSDSDSDLEITDAPARTVVNRLQASAGNSDTDGAGAVAGGNMAFHAPFSSSRAHQPGFKIPSLIRRATSNLSSASSSTTTTTTSASASFDASKTNIRRGGTGKSNIHAQAREAERRKVLEKGEERRKAGVRKMVRRRGERSVLGSLGGGFE
jgi:mediator of replication checkpoint protein 1